MDQDLDDWGVESHLTELDMSTQETALKPSPFTLSANLDAWRRMDHYTRETRPYPLCFKQSEWNEYIKSRRRSERRPRASTAQHPSMAKRRKTEIRASKWRHMTGEVGNDATQQETATELALRQQR